jgi:transcriptional regulator with XRE-family HTH domain
MSTYTPPVREWVDPLRNLALGISMASLFLVPTGSYPIPLVEQKPAQSEIDFIVTLPDGFVDLRTIYYRTPFGLETPVLRETVQHINEIQRDSIPHILRDMSGLSLETLASLAHVSRNAYYKWLNGKGVSDEHAGRLTELLDTFRTISDLRGSNLKEFLETSSPAGRPIDLLTAGKNDVVIGLALRPLSDHIDTVSVSNAARDLSGLPGWARSAVKLNWGAPRLSAAELDSALDRLSPRAQSSQVESFGDTDEDDEAFLAWGLVLE